MIHLCLIHTPKGGELSKSYKEFTHLGCETLSFFNTRAIPGCQIGHPSLENYVVYNCQILYI